MRVWLRIVYKFTENYYHSRLFSEFIQTQKRYPTSQLLQSLLLAKYLISIAAILNVFDLRQIIELGNMRSFINAPIICCLLVPFQIVQCRKRSLQTYGFRQYWFKIPRQRNKKEKTLKEKTKTKREGFQLTVAKNAKIWRCFDINMTLQRYMDVESTSKM